MKTLLVTLILSSSLAMPSSAFYFPEVSTGDGSTDWSDLFGSQKARETLNNSSKEGKAVAHYDWGKFKGNSAPYIKSATASFEFLTPSQIGSYVTNVGRMLADQTGQSKEMDDYEVLSIMYYLDSVKANTTALAKGQLRGIVGGDTDESFWSKLFKPMKTSIPEGEEREYIHFMGQLGLT